MHHPTIRNILKENLPFSRKANARKIMVQARVDSLSVKEAKRLMKEDGLNWTRLFDMLIKSYIEYRGKK